MCVLVSVAHCATCAWPASGDGRGPLLTVPPTAILRAGHLVLWVCLQVKATDVCGCPLHNSLVTTAMCREPKKTCYKHFCWEKLRRAEIDLARLNMVWAGLHA